MLLHGGRMALGAIYLMYIRSGKPWLQIFAEGDLSRYEYAKQRWIQHLEGGDGDALWCIKQQHDTLMQAFANSVTLAGPVLLASTNTASFQYYELIGAVAWAV